MYNETTNKTNVTHYLMFYFHSLAEKKTETLTQLEFSGH